MRLDQIISCLFFIFAFGYSQKPDIKLGVLYDNINKNVADLICETIYSIELSDFHLNCVKIEHINGDDLSIFLMDNKISAVLSVVNKLNCSSVQKAKQIFPFFSILRSLDSCNRNEDNDNMIDLFPSNLALVSAMTNSAAQYGWKEAIVLEKHNKEVQFSFSDLQYSRDNGMDTLAFEADSNEESLRNTLKIARKAGIRSYVLSCSVVDVLNILRVAEDMQLVNQNFHWFIPNVFVDPSIVDAVAGTGVKLSIVSSPLITPLATSLLKSYSITTNSTEEIATRLYYDVIKALTRLVVQQIEQTCQKLLSQGYLSSRNVCSVDVLDISLWNETVLSALQVVTTPAPITTTTEDHHHDIKKRDQYSSVVTLQDKGKSKRKKSLIMAQGKSRSKRNSEIVAVNIGTNLNYAQKKIGSIKSRKRRALNETGCVFPWSSNLLSSITGNNSASMPTPEQIANSFSYKTTVDLCSRRHFEWLSDKNTMSSALVNNLEGLGPTLTYIIEIVEEKPVIVGYHTWTTTKLNVSYQPFSTNDVQLPQRPLKVCAVWHTPWLSRETNMETGDYIFKGYLFDMITELSKSINFSFEIIINPEFPKILETSTTEIESLMFKMFEQGSCDLFLHAKGVRGGRLGKSDVVELSLAYQQPSMFLITKRLKKEASVDIWQFMTPFHTESWIFLWTSLLMISLFMAWLNKENPNEYQKISHTFGPNSSPADHLGILNSLWFNFGSLVQQGVDIIPRSKAVKTLTASWWIFALTIITAYTANMTLFLTQNNNGLIETLEELANQKEFGYGIMYDNPMLNLFLPDAKERPYTTLYNYFKKSWNDTVFYSHSDAFDRLSMGNFYLLASFETAVEALYGSCRFDKVGAGFYKYQFSLPFPSGSLLLPVFNDHIARLRDVGVLTSLENKWFSLEDNCETRESKIDDQLDLKSFIGMYVFLILGCFIGGVICALETGCVSWGGLGGIFGKAHHYEFQENNREQQKEVDQLEEEFTGWKGGWGVWRFKEWSKGDPNEHPDLPEITKDCCEMCGKTKVGSQVQKVKMLPKKLVYPKEKSGDTINLIDTDSGRSSAVSDQLNYNKESISSNIQVISVKPLTQELPPVNVQKPLPGLQPKPQTIPVIPQEPPEVQPSKPVIQSYQENPKKLQKRIVKINYRSPSILSIGSHSSLASTAITWSTSDLSTQPSSNYDVTSVSEMTSPPPPCGYEDDDDDDWTDED